MQAILGGIGSALLPTVIETIGNVGKSLVTTIGNIGSKKIESIGSKPAPLMSFTDTILIPRVDKLEEKVK